MRIADDGKSIDITIDEVLKLARMGYIIVCNDGNVIAIKEKED